jgi:hypothetical protein
MGFSVGFRVGPVRVSNKGISAGVSAGPFSYSGFTPWGGRSSGGGSRGGGGGGTRVRYIERLTAKQIREAGEEEARQDALREEREEARREAERARREAEDAASAARRAALEERIAQREREWAEEQREQEEQRAREEAERARAEAERDAADRIEWTAAQRERGKSWVRHAKRHGATHAVIWFSWAGSHDEEEVTVPVEEAWRTIKAKAPTGMGYLCEEPVASAVGIIDGQWCTDFF